MYKNYALEIAINSDNKKDIDFYSRTRESYDRDEAISGRKNTELKDFNNE